METKLDSRQQAQFPATFPDTFKDFFAMMSEDEDHMELFSNLLEDKVIPRTNRHNQRRCGGSLRCTNAPTTNFGRSNSFRVNRPVNNYCKHVKYCCLHQKQYPRNYMDLGYGSPNDEEDRDRDHLQSIKNRPPSLSLAERSFECESCEESDTISTTSSTTATIPYNAINNRQQPQPQSQSQSQSQHIKGFHSKGSIPRIVQQCGLRESISGTNVAASCGGIGSSSGSGGGGGGGSSSGVAGPGSSAAVAGGSGPSSVIAGTVSSNSGNNAVGGRTTSTTLFTDINAGSSSSSTPVSMTKCFSDKLNCCSRASNMRSQKSPILNRRRSSSIVATLLASDNKIFRNSEDPPPWTHSIPHSCTRERLSHIKSPVNTTAVHSLFKGKPNDGSGGGITYKQTMSGAVSPQFPSMSSNALLGMIGAGSNTTTTNTIPGTGSAGISTAITPTTQSKFDGFLSGSVAAISSQPGSKHRQRMRTSSMPAESRKPRLADTRRAAIHCADMDMEYYRLRSFSITSHGICNLGDSVRSRRSRSINSVTSTGTSNSERDRHNSNASRTSGDIVMEHEIGDSGGNIGGGAGEGGEGSASSIPAYKIAVLGASGVGKTALTYQFTTSDYICAYDLSLDDDYGQKTVSVLLDGMETDLEIIDHPACEMSTEAFCSTYNIDLFVVVYSVVDRNSFKAAERILHYLKDNEMLLTRGAILVGNKTDLERQREVQRQTGRRLAKEICCKFIETSSGLDHNVDELLVGVVAQVKLNPQRIHNLTDKERQRLSLSNAIQKHRRIENPIKKIVKQKSICKDFDTPNNLKQTGSKSGPIKKNSKRVLNLESILKVSESEMDDDDDDDGGGGGGGGGRHRRDGGDDNSRARRFTKKNSAPKSADSSCSSSPKKSSNSNSYDNNQYYEQTKNTSIMTTSTNMNLTGDTSNCTKERTVSRLSNRTKIFLASILKFKKNLNVKRRSSSSCSDLFVI